MGQGGQALNVGEEQGAQRGFQDEDRGGRLGSPVSRAVERGLYYLVPNYNKIALKGQHL